MRYKMMHTITDPAFLVILSLSILKPQTKAVMDCTLPLHVQLKTVKTACGRSLRVSAKELKSFSVVCILYDQGKHRQVSLEQTKLTQCAIHVEV